MVSTAGHFDYELVREYVLNIRVKDGGEPPLSDVCVVTVSITDANDNKPVFSQASYSASIREDAKNGDKVTKVRNVSFNSIYNYMSGVRYLPHYRQVVMAVCTVLLPLFTGRCSGC